MACQSILVRTYFQDQLFLTGTLLGRHEIFRVRRRLYNISKFKVSTFHVGSLIISMYMLPPYVNVMLCNAMVDWPRGLNRIPNPHAGSNQFKQFFQGSGKGKVEDNLTSANPLSYTTNGSRVDLGSLATPQCI